MRTNKNSIFRLGLFTLLFLIFYFIFDNKIYKSIISSCFTGTFVGMISSYILYLSDFKTSISEYLIEYSKIIKLNIFLKITTNIPKFLKIYIKN